MNILIVIVGTFWLLIPSYIANPSAVIFKGKLPMDFNKNFIDGRRILGKGKTWKGFIGGTLSGTFFGIVEETISTFVNSPYIPEFSNSFLYAIIIVFFLSFSSMLGDSCGSFIKRRMNFPSGSEALFLDQYPFIICSLIFFYIFNSTLFLKYIWNIYSIIFLIIITIVLHRLVNIIGYKMGKKDVPW
ncbi:MAG: CDP-2,3-bis-(O-geranylgeranyl)-sn-glycerol synthase [Thermoplasmata archaeon]|jgi:CDP-2,3-bis-(O-geranylgeranyl)-sn-glycerol synthase